MKRIVAATKNKGKIREIEAITSEFGMRVISRDDAGVPYVEVEETGITFEENSRIKAEAIMKLCGEITIADDSGLEVDCLGGAPGVLSARYAGVDGDDKANNEKLIANVGKFPESERSARFVSVITMVFPDGRLLQARGTVEGHIVLEPRGEGGFGYDPLFVPCGHERTFGQFEPEEKNAISHRANALRKLRELLKEEDLAGYEEEK